MSTNPLEQMETVDAYSPKEEERAFIQEVSRRFMEMKTLKEESLAILDHRTLEQYEDDSIRDYGVFEEFQGSMNDPVKPYVTSISRNKTDSFVNNLSRGLLFPSVTAQNGYQEVDRAFARVGRALLEWAHRGDGYPDESGQIKAARYIHTMAVEGTVHVMDVVTKDGLHSEHVPNREIYIPNFWQPSIQKQPRVYRAKLNATYEEAQSQFGHLPNFKHVQKGGYEWLTTNSGILQEKYNGIYENDRVQIFYVYEMMTPEQLEKEKKAGRVRAKCKKHYYYNVLINGIPMFPVDNILPYRHGLLPISVGRFSFFAKSYFYWGESAPNKFRYDKKWRDGWMTLLRHKAKLNALKPQFSLDGNYVGDEIYIPGNVINLQEDPKLKMIEGVGEPVNNSDLEMLRIADREIESSSVSSMVEGRSEDQRKTAREAVITQNYAQIALDAFSQQVAALVHARTFPILLALFEKISKGELKKLVVSDQALEKGERGSMELRFQRMKMPNEEGFEDEYRAESLKLASAKKKARNMGEPRDIVIINTRALDEVTLYLKSDTASFSQNYDALKKEQFNQRAQNIYFQRPEFNQREVARSILVNNEDDEMLLAEEPPQGAPQGQAPQQGQPPQEQAPDMGSPEDMMALLGQ